MSVRQNSTSICTKACQTYLTTRPQTSSIRRYDPKIARCCQTVPVSARNCPSMPTTTRPYRPQDHAVVCRIFSEGMIGLSTPWLQTVVQDWSGHVRFMSIAMAIAASLAALGAPLSISVALVLLATPLRLIAVYVPARLMIGKYVQSSIDDDLSRISEVYNSDKGGGFWVAEVVHCDETQCTPPQVAGCVGLEIKPGNVGELRRMSVDRRFRRAGIARALAQTLIDQAKKSGLKEVFLTTSALQQPAMQLYRSMGWREEDKPTIYQGLQIHKFVLKLQD